MISWEKSRKVYQGTKMKKHLILTAIAAVSFTGCTNPMSSVITPSIKKQSYQKPTAAKSAAYQDTMIKVALSTRDDSKYRKLELDTAEKKAWFKDLMYRLWDRQITRNQFIAEGLAHYPSRRYEFNFVAQGFQKHS